MALVIGAPAQRIIWLQQALRRRSQNLVGRLPARTSASARPGFDFQICHLLSET